jgi:hypothetical protein
MPLLYPLFIILALLNGLIFPFPARASASAALELSISNRDRTQTVEARGTVSIAGQLQFSTFDGSIDFNPKQLSIDPFLAFSTFSQ